MKQLQRVFDKGDNRHYKKGQVLLHQGDSLDHVFYVKKGYLKMYSILDSGEERILIVLGPGDAFPIIASIFITDYELKYFYEAMTDLDVYRLEQPKFAKLVNNDFKAIQIVLSYIVNVNQQVVDRLAILENKSAKDKVSTILPYLIEKCGKPLKPQKVKLSLKLTHQDIANLTGLTRETTSIELKKLEEDDVIEYQRGYICVNERKLNAQIA